MDKLYSGDRARRLKTIEQRHIIQTYHDTRAPTFVFNVNQDVIGCHTRLYDMPTEHRRKTLVNQIFCRLEPILVPTDLNNQNRSKNTFKVAVMLEAKLCKDVSSDIDLCLCPVEQAKKYVEGAVKAYTAMLPQYQELSGLPELQCAAITEVNSMSKPGCPIKFSVLRQARTTWPELQQSSGVSTTAQPASAANQPQPARELLRTALQTPAQPNVVVVRHRNPAQSRVNHNIRLQTPASQVQPRFVLQHLHQSTATAPSGQNAPVKFLVDKFGNIVGQQIGIRGPTPNQVLVNTAPPPSSSGTQSLANIAPTPQDHRYSQQNSSVLPTTLQPAPPPYQPFTYNSNQPDPRTARALRCPFAGPDNCESSINFRTSKAAIDHLSLVHFKSAIETQVRKLQEERGLDVLECPAQPCGFYSPTRKDLCRHFGLHHDLTLELVKAAKLDFGLNILGAKNPAELVECPTCGLNILKPYLTSHLALVHLMAEYRKEIAGFTGNECGRKQVGVGESWATVGEFGQTECGYTVPRTVRGATKAETRQAKQILKIKHCTTHVSPEQIMQKYNTKGRARSFLFQFEKKSNAEVSKSCKKDENEVKTIICKVCRRLFATKPPKSALVINGRWSEDVNAICSIDDFLLKAKTKANGAVDWCSKCHNVESITCRVCDVSVTIGTEALETHMNKDEHLQKQRVHQLFGIYCAARGLGTDIVDGQSGQTDPAVLEFFITILHCRPQGIAVMNCLATLVNILDISPAQYSSLYTHVDKIAKCRMPNFLCYSCNYLEYGRTESLAEHINSAIHTESLVRLMKSSVCDEFLSCTACGLIFNSQNIEKHENHFVLKGKSTQTITDYEKRKRKGEAREKKGKQEGESRRIVGTGDGLDEDLENRDESDMDDNSDDSDFEVEEKSEGTGSDDELIEDVVDEEPNNSEQLDQLDALELELSDEASSGETTEEENDDEEREIYPPSDNYFYFCLECEAGRGTEQAGDLVRIPLSIDLAGHMKSTGHQSFEPIGNPVRVNLYDIAHSPAHHRSVVRRWKRLVREEVITDVEYEQPRKCLKCQFSAGDAIEMFKHIRDAHIGESKAVSQPEQNKSFVLLSSTLPKS